MIGDPRRPYPLDFVMRRGILGQISQQPHSGIGSDDELARSRHSSAVDDHSVIKPGTNEAQNDPYSTGMHLASIAGLQTCRIIEELLYFNNL